jgi:hypothetical protein
MLLSPESHKQIEAFLRDHLRSDALELPPVIIYAGRGARWLTSTFGILAITFGRRIFVASKVIGRDEHGRLTLPAGLIAHEATHVVQYSQNGFIGFLLSYLGEYWRALKEQPGWGRAARDAAYFAIEQEREAYQAESAYAVWAGLEKMNEEKVIASLKHADEDKEPES